MKTIPPFHRFTDSHLIEVMPRLVGRECAATAVVVAGLIEFDSRRLYLPLGYPSMFQYCLQCLKLTEDATFNRLEAARAARKFPGVLDLLHSGDLSLTAARMLAPHLTAGNSVTVLEQARHKTKREIELLVARLKPQPPVPSVIRKLPEPKPAPVLSIESNDAHASQCAAEPAMSLAGLLAATAPATELPPSRRPVIAPLSEAHYKLQVTISAAARERLSQIQDLMRHRLPNGDPAAIVEHALEVLHAELLKQKAAQVAQPRLGKDAADAKGRYVAASVRNRRRGHGVQYRIAMPRPQRIRVGAASGSRNAGAR